MGSNNLSAAANYKGTHTAANTILNAVTLFQSMYPSAKISVIGVLPQRCEKRTEAGIQINNILKFRLPPSVNFIQSPFDHWNPTYFSDDVHLNSQGYIFLFNTTHFKSFISSPSCPLTTQPETRNPVVNEDLGIGEAEFLGSGWNGGSPLPSPPPPPLLPSPLPSLPAPAPTPWDALPRVVPPLAAPWAAPSWAAPPTWAVSSSFLLKDQDFPPLLRAAAPPRGAPGDFICPSR